MDGKFARSDVRTPNNLPSVLFGLAKREDDVDDDAAPTPSVRVTMTLVPTLLSSTVVEINWSARFGYGGSDLILRDTIFRDKSRARMTERAMVESLLSFL